MATLPDDPAEPVGADYEEVDGWQPRGSVVHGFTEVDLDGADHPD